MSLRNACLHNHPNANVPRPPVGWVSTALTVTGPGARRQLYEPSCSFG